MIPPKGMVVSYSKNTGRAHLIVEEWIKKNLFDARMVKHWFRYNGPLDAYEFSIMWLIPFKVLAALLRDGQDGLEFGIACPTATWEEAKQMNAVKRPLTISRMFSVEELFRMRPDNFHDRISHMIALLAEAFESRTVAPDAIPKDFEKEARVATLERPMDRFMILTFPEGPYVVDVSAPDETTTENAEIEYRLGAEVEEEGEK
jgi:hypothetical protein